MEYHHPRLRGRHRWRTENRRTSRRHRPRRSNVPSTNSWSQDPGQAKNAPTTLSLLNRPGFPAFWPISFLLSFWYGFEPKISSLRLANRPNSKESGKKVFSFFGFGQPDFWRRQVLWLPKKLVHRSPTDENLDPDRSPPTPGFRIPS